ncbi:MAG: translation elongation factor 4 [Verrucomicrobiales bacterium]|jgi:GTP-binding protein LepA|nr:translation elongation factor 4 [Verrucomicrobiales bacterium]
MPSKLTRNLCIIAHIDHGKTTLSDRLLQRTGTVSNREIEDQYLDAMDLERERGITIKAHPVTMHYTARDGNNYKLNLIDTPGHVDFTYEVSRSLSACEGAVVLVDAAQGVEAQTVANYHLAVKQGLKIIPVINKIDLPNANLEAVKQQLEDILAIPAEEAILASAKAGIGIEDILEAVIQRVPPPASAGDNKLRALVFDSVFDTYRGVVAYVRVVSGELRAGTPVLLMQTNQKYEVKEVGIFTPKPLKAEILRAGDSGYVVANIKTTAELKIGDTITSSVQPATDALPGFKEVHPMVFAGIYPINSADFEALKVALGKLQLNDSALTFIQENSVALGFGFRCGFLGLLHMEIVQERLRREYEMDIISTYPSVVYQVLKTNGEIVEVDNPTFMPDPTFIEEIREPMVKAFIMIPGENIGDVLQLVRDRRGECLHTESLDSRRVMLTIDIPLNEILVDFNDKIKSMTRGYGSMDYEFAPYRASDLVKLDILVNDEPMDAFSTIVHREKAAARGRQITAKLKEVIPPQLFKVALQAAIGGKIVAREDVKTVGKNVIAKCYGGDITRKRKLLEKQKEGKKKMKQFGKVNIPQEAFLEVLKSSN